MEAEVVECSSDGRLGGMSEVIQFSILKQQKLDIRGAVKLILVNTQKRVGHNATKPTSDCA